MISNCGKDENGKYTGGQAGDNTGKEWHVIPWYNRPWNCVLRHPKEDVRKLIASMAKAAAQNDCIGYDQWQRDTFFEQLEANGYRVKDIKTKCEADCSSGVCSIVKAVGFRKNIKRLKDISITTTHYMRDMFEKAGFEVLTDSKYLTSDDYLLPGDILLNDGAHVATNLDKGSKVDVSKELAVKTEKNAENNKKDKTTKKTDEYIKVRTNGSVLNCRKSPNLASSVLGVFKNGEKLNLIEKTNDDWYKVKGKTANNKNIIGYCRSKWLRRI